MNIKIIEYIAEIVKSIVAFCNKIADSSNPEKYTDGVNALGQNVDETYAKMRELIAQDDDLSTAEKVEKLERLAISQQAARQSCEKAIIENKEHTAKIIAEIFAALATCGIACIPKVFKGYKKATIVIPEDVTGGALATGNIEEISGSVDEA